MSYEQIPEDTERRNIIPTKDYRLANSWTNRYERITYLYGNKVRQGASNTIKHVRSQQMVYGVIIFLLSIWLSGFYAHAGMSFESLLSVVIGFIILTIVVSTTGKRK